LVKTSTLAIGVAAMGLWSLPVAADTCCRGFYVSGEAVGGWGMVDDVSSAGSTTGPLTDDDYGDSVAGGGLSLGYDFSYRYGAPIRVEGEFVHIVRLDADTRPIFADGTLPGAGIENNISIRTLMINAFYDWDLGTWYTPHFGFGVGYARNNSEAGLNDFGSGLRQTVDTDTDNLAWSLMAGVQFDIGPNWFADVGYRFLDAGELEAGPFANGVKLEADDVRRHDLMIGFGYRF
jgi:opacity protein-like surface antigen